MIGHRTFGERLERFETRLWTDGFASLGLGSAPPGDAALADRVLELSDLYTLERDRLSGGAVRSSHLLARTLYYLCADAPKVHLVTDELARRGVWPSCGRLTVDDLGCGVGATSVGFLLTLPEGTDVVLRGVDEDPAALDIWRKTVRLAADVANVEIDAEAVVGDVASVDSGPADLTLCQTTLNERLAHSGDGESAAAEHGAETIAMVRRWCEHGVTVLIEPALRVSTRPLQRLRDALIRDGLTVLAPCPHQAACPMLVSERDWCHEIRRWRPTPRVDAIQRLTRRRDERLKFSFMALAAPGDRSRGAAVDGRLVSDPLVTKGKTERVVCLADGSLRKLRLLDRERTPENSALATSPRGALLTIEGLSERDRIDAAVRVVGALDRGA